MCANLPFGILCDVNFHNVITTTKAVAMSTVGRLDTASGPRVPPTIVRPIGSGSYGSVFSLQDGTVAKRFKEQGDTEHGLPRDGVREIAVLRGLSGEHVVPVLDAFVDDKNSLWCVMPLATRGTLRHEMTLCRRKTAAKIRQYASDMYSALAFIHSRGVVHRDVKPENMLVFDDGHVKLSDFGSAIVCCDARSPLDVPAAMRNEVVTTLWYRAPEVCFGLISAQGPAMDVWAAGLVLCEMCSPVCRSPFGNATTERSLCVAILCRMGIPNATNDLMPSYTRCHSSPPQGFDEAIKIPLQNRPWDSPSMPSWASSIASASIVLEPTRRLSASACCAMICPERRATCPKTPIVNTTSILQPSVAAIRSKAGHLIYETCVCSRVYRSRRAFHVAIRMLDRACAAGKLQDEKDMPVICAALCSIASKVCDSYGIGPNWSYILGNRAARLKEGPAGGIGKYRLCVDVVSRAEVELLQLFSFAAWDVTPLDLTPTDLRDDDTYERALDMVVASLDTSQYPPHDVVEVAAFVAESMREPNGRAPRAFPAKLGELLESSARVLSAISKTKISEELENVHWF